MIKIKEDEMVGHVARVEAMRYAYKMLVGKPEWKRELVRSRRKWEGNLNGS
jgi:hypothetical protein